MKLKNKINVKIYPKKPISGSYDQNHPIKENNKVQFMTSNDKIKKKNYFFKIKVKITIKK